MNERRLPLTMRTVPVVACTVPSGVGGATATIEGPTHHGRWHARAAGGGSLHPGDRSTSVAGSLASRVARVLARVAEHRGAASLDTDPWETLMDHHRTATTMLDARPSTAPRRSTSNAATGSGRTWVDTRSTDVLLAALDRITTEGWDGPTACELLRVVRARIVVPLVVASRLQGAAAEQAEASGWERAWEVLSRPSLREARHPGRCCGWRCATRSATRSRRR